jgi:hypothetical protein
VTDVFHHGRPKSGGLLGSLLGGSGMLREPLLSSKSAVSLCVSVASATAFANHVDHVILNDGSIHK